MQFKMIKKTNKNRRKDDMITKWDVSRGKTAIFIGSSVCVGSGATNNRGWSKMVAERMERNGWTTSNCAIGGQTTADILLRLQRDVINRKPAVCFVGLGLSNEGLSRTDNPAVPCGIFLGNLRKIAQALQDAGILPIIGGVYPNNDYTEEQYKWVRFVYDEMDKWDVPVLQWLDGIEDGKGHYPPGWEHDAWHPNDIGYAYYYESIPTALWDILDCPKE